MSKPSDSQLLQLASEPLTVEAAATLDIAAQKMRQKHVGSLVVVQEGSPIGMITDRDIALAALRRPAGTPLQTIESVASRPLLTLDAGGTLDEATGMFGRYGVRRLGLTSHTGELVGILSSDMVLVHLGEQLDALINGIRREFQEERDPTSAVTSGFGPE